MLEAEQLTQKHYYTLEGNQTTPSNRLYGSDGTRLILWPGTADAVPYSFGIAGSTLWCSVPTGAIHAFYTGTTERMRIDSGVSISCTGNLFMGTNNSFPDIRLGSTNGNNLAIATSAVSFSTSTAVKDMILRSLNRLILQSGRGNYGIFIDTNNDAIVRGKSVVNGDLSIGNGLIYLL